MILKSEQRFIIEKHNKFTAEANEVVMSANDDKRIQLIDSI